MSESQTEPMLLGLTYWPRRTAFGWWQAFDRGEAREELAHVRALGCGTVRLCLRWEDFQPAPQRVNGAALRALEHALDAAHAAGLRVVAALFPVALGGALHLPDWANRTDPIAELRQATRLGPRLAVQADAGPPLIYDGGYHPNQTRDLFSTPATLGAQRYLIREVAGYFGTHPALWAWQLGEGLERAHRPATPEAVYAWLEALAEALREQHPGARLLGVTSARGLTLRVGPRPEQLAASCDMLGVAADPPQLATPADQTAYPAYLHALTAALGRAPACVLGLGLASAPEGRGGWVADSSYGRALRTYCGDEEQQAAFVGGALERLRRAGASGVWLAAYADYPAALWRTPPLDRCLRERALGLVDAEGREKPAAAALRAFAASRPAVSAVAPPIDADPERHWRDPERSFKELWRAFAEEQ